MPSNEPETLESLTEAVQGVMEVLSAHAVLITNIIRALDDEGIEVRGVMAPPKPRH